MTSDYLNQCWLIASWIILKIQGNLNQNTKQAFQRRAFKMLSTKYWQFNSGLNVLTHWSLLTYDRGVCNQSHYRFILWLVDRSAFSKKDVFSEIWINIQHFSLTEMNFKIYKYALTSIWILIIRIRQSRDRLIFIMEIPYMERPSLYWDGALASMCEGMFSNAASLQALSSVEVYSDVRTSPLYLVQYLPHLVADGAAPLLFVLIACDTRGRAWK